MKSWRVLLLLAVMAPWQGQAADLPRVFSDGMVLQRERPIPVWGKAAPGASVRVELAGKSAVAKADAHGDWRVRLPAHAAGGPYVMHIEDGAGARVLSDVLIGDVWLASGQSNMEWPLEQTADAQAEIARATDPMIRHFKVPKSWSGEPQWQLQGGQWVAASPQAAGGFSAIAYYFAHELRKTTGVPIGIVDSSWGGSRIEAWMDADAQGLDATALTRQGRELREADQRALVQTNRNLSRWTYTPGEDKDWQAGKLDTSNWADIAVPSLWEAAGWNGMDGVAWYRATFTLTKAEAKAGVVLGVGRIDDSDVTWVNGRQVGETRMQYNLPRAYTVPASLLHAGVNTVAVRVTDTGGGGGIHGPASEVFVQPQGGAPRALDGAWKFRPAKVAVALVDDKNQHPTLIYNAMVHPLQPYALRGVIWYQGESNANTAQEASRYRQQFPGLIEQWRAQWDAPRLPFLWVQLASFGSGVDTPQQSPWALLRESQSATLSLPATAQAVTIDIGDAADIHPRNKRDVGKRLALAARHVAYAETLVFRGPVFKSARFEGASAIVDFDLDGSALAVRGGGTQPQGFQLAGADRVFHPATAVIEGSRVVVRSAAVPTPVAVRYAWRDSPQDADLVNQTQLPASPFRSDAW